MGFSSFDFFFTEYSNTEIHRTDRTCDPELDVDGPPLLRTDRYPDYNRVLKGV